MQIKMKKAQSASESLMVLAIAIVFVIPLAIMFYSSTGLRLEVLNLMEAKALSQHISDSAGEVWYAGKGARKTLLVSYPSGMSDIFLGGDKIRCIDNSGEILCEQEMVNEGREIIINITGESGASSQLVTYSPAPLKNCRIAGCRCPNNECDSSQLLGAIKSPGGTINSGLAVLIFKNEGPYVNVVRYTPKVNY